jgi:hypothetical protein
MAIRLTKTQEALQNAVSVEDQAIREGVYNLWLVNKEETGFKDKTKIAEFLLKVLCLFFTFYNSTRDPLSFVMLTKTAQ